MITKNGGGILVKQKKIAFLKMTILGIGFIVLSVCVFLSTILESQRWLTNPDYADVLTRIHLGLYVTLIPFFIALYQTLKLLKYIERKNAFSDLAVNSLRTIKNCAFIIIGIYVMGMVYLALSDAMQNGLVAMSIVNIFTALVISIFAMVLEELLRSAIAIKSENDLTV